MSACIGGVGVCRMWVYRGCGHKGMWVYGCVDVWVYGGVYVCGCVGVRG